MRDGEGRRRRWWWWRGKVPLCSVGTMEEEAEGVRGDYEQGDDDRL